MNTPAPPPLTRTGYLLTIRRIDGSILKTTEAGDEAHARAIAELWAKQLRCTVTSEPALERLGESLQTKRPALGREPKDFRKLRAVDPCE